ncbi:hypothetical protein MRB53_037878 [Persea americana]|nr:hypothetical protein MRB53_037878 [Persea americana]
MAPSVAMGSTIAVRSYVLKTAPRPFSWDDMPPLRASSIPNESHASMKALQPRDSRMPTDRLTDLAWFLKETGPSRPAAQSGRTSDELPSSRTKKNGFSFRRRFQSSANLLDTRDSKGDESMPDFRPMGAVEKISTSGAAMLELIQAPSAIKARSAPSSAHLTARTSIEEVGINPETILGVPVVPERRQPSPTSIYEDRSDEQVQEYGFASRDGMVPRHSETAERRLPSRGTSSRVSKETPRPSFAMKRSMTGDSKTISAPLKSTIVEIHESHGLPDAPIHTPPMFQDGESGRVLDPSAALSSNPIVSLSSFMPLPEVPQSLTQPGTEGLERAEQTGLADEAGSRHVRPQSSNRGLRRTAHEVVADALFSNPSVLQQEPVRHRGYDTLAQHLSSRSMEGLASAAAAISGASTPSKYSRPPTPHSRVVDKSSRHEKAHTRKVRDLEHAQHNVHEPARSKNAEPPDSGIASSRISVDEYRPTHLYDGSTVETGEIYRVSSPTDGQPLAVVAQLASDERTVVNGDKSRGKDSIESGSAAEAAASCQRDAATERGHAGTRPDGKAGRRKTSRPGHDKRVARSASPSVINHEVAPSGPDLDVPFFQQPAFSFPATASASATEIHAPVPVSSRQRPAPLLSAPPTGPLPQQLPQQLPQHRDASRLEARVELLERENRLLEAALMAVLKTSGKLNGCPCGGMGVGDEGVKWRRRLRSDPAQDGDVQRAGDSSEVEHRHGPEDPGLGVGVAGKTPLELYMATRLSKVVGRGENAKAAVAEEETWTW